MVDWASLLTHDWASLLIQTLEESPLLSENTFQKRNLRCNSWQCHILACMFSSLAPRIRSEVADWNLISRHVDDYEREAVQIAMKETFHAIKQAEAFWQSCACEDWGFKALTSTACTGEALTVHIHNLFWCISGLVLATRVSLGFSEDQLNAIMERQAYCWSTNISRYIHLGAESLDLRYGLSVLDEEKLECDGMEETELKSVPGPKARMMKFLLQRLKWVLGTDSSEVEALHRDLRIDFQDLGLEDRHLIGSDGYGSFYVASWLGVRVVIKECSLQALDRLKERVPMLLRMRNPFILQLIGWSVNEEADVCHMVMEAVDTDLGSFIKARSETKDGEPPFPLHVAVDMMLQIARGMWYLHRNRILHGDLKASNVLLDVSQVPELAGEGYARVKLSDFMLANELQPLETSSTSIVSSSRVAEICKDGDSRALLADVYSFGLLCFQILTGRHPFFGIPDQDVLPRIKQGFRPDLPSSCPILLSDCIKACWDGCPENRPDFGVICGLFRHLKLIITRPHHLEQALNFFPEEDTQLENTKPQNTAKAASSDMELRLELININVNVLHLSTPTEIYSHVAAESFGQKSSLGLRALESMSTELLRRMDQGIFEDVQKFVLANAGTLKVSLVEGFSGLLRSWSTTLGMGTLDMWLPYLPAEWKLLHTIALGIALCLRYVSKTPPRIGFYSEDGIDGFYPIEPQNILLNCQYKTVLLLDNSTAAWKRQKQWGGVHPHVAGGEYLLLSIEAYTTYFFGKLLQMIIKERHSREDEVQAPRIAHPFDQEKRYEFVLTNLAMRCSELKCLSMTEVVTTLVNECRPSRR